MLYNLGEALLAEHLCYFLFQNGNIFMKHTDKGRSVFVRRLISKGEYIYQYDGELITSNIVKERNHEYNTSGAGSFIL